ncbi:MAG: aminoglycoside phosphotransferase family protein [Prosthecobacter sp.]|nr:aminoglycoside phosphotransferase family protein [Prosthecobacter sp.]
MSRCDIHYWKCDRPAAFHGTQELRDTDPLIEPQLREAMRERMQAKEIELTPASSQGNHLTWKAVVDGVPLFVRVENGPDGDDYLEMESAVMRQARAAGVLVPKVAAVDASRTRVPFAWQAQEHIPFPDLNHWHKQGRLDVAHVAFEIGVAVARWQSINPSGFGPFARENAGFHARYEDYFRLRLEQHLGFLVAKAFLTVGQREEIERAIAAHDELLDLAHGCLVHKDLALWNILGSENRIAAFIDFDDAISGDPMDDLSLLACFHDAAFLAPAFAGYRSVRPLPENYRRRFWLHLLRNMIVKSVIRVGAGYFERDDGFFLINAGGSGGELRQMTQQRLALALRGLESDADISLLL